MMRRAPVLLVIALVSSCSGDPTGNGFATLVIATASLPAAFVGVPYSAGVGANGGDGAYTWDLTAGSLPPGLALSVEDLPDNDALITGTPQSAGSYPFTVRVQSGDGQTATRAFTLQVSDPAAVVITRALLPPGLVGGAYDAQLTASGGTGGFTWSLVGGALPPGLTLSAAGRVQGTPTATDTAVFTVRASSGAGSADRTYTVPVVANRTDRYHFTPYPVVTVPTAIRPHVDAAFARWEQVVRGDLPAIAIPVNFLSGDDCGGFADAVNGTATDDVIVLVNIVSIDGPGQVLAQAGPCGIRSASGLPFVGVLTLDADDLNAIVGTETLTELIVHEIGHVLGFGSIWSLKGVLSGEGTSDPRFTGATATAEYNALGGTGNVPVENTGGEGTRDSHWRESIFGNELMTGFIEQIGVDQPLSRVTAASLADLGYTIEINAAEAFSLGAALSGAASRSAKLGYDVVLRAARVLP